MTAKAMATHNGSGSTCGKANVMRESGRRPGEESRGFRAQAWKMSSGSRAETVTFGTSTTLLIRRSTATLAMT
jgi:hypothetical protein